MEALGAAAADHLALVTAYSQQGSRAEEWGFGGSMAWFVIAACSKPPGAVGLLRRHLASKAPSYLCAASNNECRCRGCQGCIQGPQGLYPRQPRVSAAGRRPTARVFGFCGQAGLLNQHLGAVQGPWIRLHSCYVHALRSLLLLLPAAAGAAAACRRCLLHHHGRLLTSRAPAPLSLYFPCAAPCHSRCAVRRWSGTWGWTRGR